MEEPMAVEDARKHFASLLNRTQWQGEHVKITRHGKVAGVLVPPDWYEQVVTALRGRDQSG